MGNQLPVPVEAGKICEACGRWRKLRLFDADSDVCIECAEDTAEQRAEKSLINALKRGVAALRSDAIEAPHISELCEQMVGSFGGLRPFTMFWKNQIDLAAVTKPGSKTVLDSCYAIAKLITLSTEHRQTAPDMGDISDEDLARVVAQLAHRTELVEHVPTRE